MKKVKKVVMGMIAGIAAFGIVFGIGYYLGDKAEIEAAEVVGDNSGKSGGLLEVVERRARIVERVESKLVEIGELSTYADEYTVTVSEDETKYWLDKFKVPGTTNQIRITCKGIVKVGYHMSDLAVDVDGGKIYVSIPEAKLNDNYVIWDSIECNESSGIFNPIKFLQYHELIEEIEKIGLEDAEEKGVYARAEENLKTLISAFLSEFQDYEIVYR